MMMRGLRRPGPDLMWRSTASPISAPRISTRVSAALTSGRCIHAVSNVTSWHRAVRLPCRSRARTGHTHVQSWYRFRRHAPPDGRGYRTIHGTAPLCRQEQGGEPPGRDGSEKTGLAEDQREFLQVLRDTLAEEGLSSVERQRVEAAIEATLEGRGAEVLAEMEKEALHGARLSPVAGPDMMNADETAAFLTALEATTAPASASPSTVAEARELFDNLATQAEEPLDYHQLRERNERRLQREQRLIDEDAATVAGWTEEQLEQVERFSAEEDELLRIMWDDDGQHDVMDGVGEQQLLFPEVFPSNVQTAPAPPADRLNPSVPHSPEFDYSFQEMMQAEFEAQMGEMQSHRHNLVQLEEMNKQRGQAGSQKRTREVDDAGRSFATGHKKTAIARVCLMPGTGKLRVNGLPIDKYFPYYNRHLLLIPFELTGTLLKYDMDAKVRGGGIAGQLDAVKYGIARALQKQDPEFRHTLKPAGLLTRDNRKVERKKSGQLKARKKFTWVKR